MEARAAMELLFERKQATAATATKELETLIEQLKADGKEAADMDEARIERVRQGRHQPLPETEAPRKAPPDQSEFEVAREIIVNQRGSDAPAYSGDRVITIVSGLPRSGTSMMMNMLDAAGLGILSDGRREADEDNPRGYFEYLPATRLRTDRDWLPEARGKAVKIVAQLLDYLEPGEQYRVILMERSLDEILLSQEGCWGVTARAFQQQLAGARAMLDRLSCPVMRVPFSPSLTEPMAVANRLGAFLEMDIDPARVSARVGARLYRSRGASTTGPKSS